MKQNEIFKRIRNHFRANEIIDAFSEMKKFADLAKNFQIEDEITCLLRRYNQLIKTYDDGGITYEDQEVKINKIIRASLKLFRGIEEKQKRDLFEKKSKKNNKYVENDFLGIVKTAIIIIELEKIKEKYFLCNKDDWERKEELLRSLRKYISHNSIELAFEVYLFLSDIATSIRGGETPDIAYLIYSLTTEFLPFSFFEKEREKVENIAKMGIQVGFELAYYSYIYLEDLEVGSQGLRILKWIYQMAKRLKNDMLTKEVIQTFDKLNDTLCRPERNDLELAKEVLNEYRKILDKPTMSIPWDFPKHLVKYV